MSGEVAIHRPMNRSQRVVTSEASRCSTVGESSPAGDRHGICLLCVDGHVGGVRRITLTSMLELVTNHRTLVAGRARELFLAVPGPKAVLRADAGISILIDQLEDTLRRGDRGSDDEIARVATKYGGLLVARGFTVGELVRGYGTVCQALMKVGQELHMSFSNREFEMLNRVLDVAIAKSPPA